MLKLKQVDARGLSCPQPVLLTQNGLKISPEGINVLVDSNTAKNNVERLIKNQGYKLSVKQENDYYIIMAEK